MVGSTPYAMRRSRGRALGSHGRVVPCRACSNSRSKVCVKYAGPMERWNDALVTPCEGESRRRLSHLWLSANTEMLRTACFLCVIGHRELLNVQQKTIEPFIKETIAPGTLVYTDEYSIYARLCAWGYDHKSVNHGRGEYARDEDGDGFCEVHVNTIEGFWSLLRSWLRPHRGISQEKLPLYLGFFEFVHNVRKRGKALLGE